MRPKFSITMDRQIMIKTINPALQRLRGGISKVVLLTGAATFLFGDKFLYEIRHVNFFTAEAVGVSCGVLLMILGAAMGSTHTQEFPADFTVQKIKNASVKSICHLDGREIAEYFRANPSVASQLLTESYDKRHSPSTFMADDGNGYSVGWYSNGYKCQKQFTDLADAATDYVLFSLRRERWSPHEG
ncbi:MAG: hypothetical protein ABSC76_21145 [Terracidiphilus sp.]